MHENRVTALMFQHPENTVPCRPRLPPSAAFGLSFPFGAAAAAATTMLSGYLGTARGDPRAQVSHLLQRRLSFCSERERHRQREHGEEAVANDDRERRRREQELLFLQRRNERVHHERLSDGEEDSFMRNYGRGAGHLMRSPSHSPPLNEPEEPDDIVPRAAAGDLSDLAEVPEMRWETKGAVSCDTARQKLGPHSILIPYWIMAHSWGSHEG